MTKSNIVRVSWCTGRDNRNENYLHASNVFVNKITTSGQIASVCVLPVDIQIMDIKRKPINALFFVFTTLRKTHHRVQVFFLLSKLRSRVTR